MTTTSNPNDPRRFALETDDTEKRFEEAYTRLKRVNTSVTTLTGQQATINTSVTTLTGQQTTTNTNVTALTSRITALETTGLDVVNATSSKFNNGFLICGAVITGLWSGAVVYNNIFTFPVPFLYPPIVTATPVYDSGSTGVVLELANISTTTATIRVGQFSTSLVQFVFRNFTANIVAIGRWK